MAKEPIKGWREIMAEHEAANRDKPMPAKKQAFKAQWKEPDMEKPAESSVTQPPSVQAKPILWSEHNDAAAKLRQILEKGHERTSVFEVKPMPLKDHRADVADRRENPEISDGRE